MLKKSLIAALALAFGVAVSPLTMVNATTLLGPGTKAPVESTVELAQKKGKKKAKKAGKKAKSKAGKCGTFMYYSKKQKKCLDAMAKR